MNQIDIENLKSTIYYTQAQIKKITGIGKFKLEKLLASGFLHFTDNTPNGRLAIKGQWLIDCLDMKNRYNASLAKKYREYCDRQIAKKRKVKVC